MIGGHGVGAHSQWRSGQHGDAAMPESKAFQDGKRMSKPSALAHRKLQISDDGLNEALLH